MEEAIERNIREKIKSKIKTDVLERERVLVREMFESEIIDKEALKRKMLMKMESEF